MEIADNILRELLKNCYFIIGTAYAGKSTMVRMLAQKHDGIECGENYHDVLMEATDPAHQPNLGYFQTMGGWHEFVSRKPEDYVAWLDGTSREAAAAREALSRTVRFISSIKAAASCADWALREASIRSSLATTANPLPFTPAPAAST